MLRELDRHLSSHSAWLVNHAERHRADPRVGTALAEAPTNSLVTTPGPEGPGFSLRNESFLFPASTEARSAGPTRKSSGASLSSCDGGLVIAADEHSDVINRRMNKSQQMRWSRRGTDLLQVRRATASLAPAPANCSKPIQPPVWPSGLAMAG